jgi:hypothetical protein
MNSKNFDLYLDMLENVNATILEHCKTGSYFGPYNMLQVKILMSLYNNFLRGNVEGYDHGVINDPSQVIMMFVEIDSDVFRLVGDVLCKNIPNEKTINYTQNDVDRWAHDLFKMMKVND